MTTIILSFSGELPASVSLLTLTDAADDSTPAGVMLPAAMSSGGSPAGSQWSYSFAATAGHTYQYTYRVTWSDSSTLDESGTIASVAAPSVTGYYAAQSDVEALFGTLNVAKWSQLDNTVDSADTARIGQSLAVADAAINTYMRGGDYAVPLSVGQDADYVTNWAAVLAGCWLYENRGFTEADPAADRYAEMKQAVYRQMSAVRSGVVVLDAARRWPVPTAPTPAVY